jgi:HEAT repeats
MKYVLAATAALGMSCAASALPRPPVTPVDMAVLKEHVRALEAGTEADQLRAVAAIKALGPRAFGATPALTAAFRDSSPRVRNEIADTLATYGPTAKAAIPLLVEAIRPPRPDSGTVYHLSMAIAALGDPGNRDMVRAYLGALYNGGRRAGCPVGDLIDRYPAGVTPAMTDYLADPIGIIRARAAQVLAHVARPPEPGKPSKLEGLPADVRRRVASALCTAIEDPDPRVRSWACGRSSLGHPGSSGRGAFRGGRCHPAPRAGRHPAVDRLPGRPGSERPRSANPRPGPGRKRVQRRARGWPATFQPGRPDRDP